MSKEEVPQKTNGDTLDDTIAGIEKSFGKGSIMMLGSKTFVPVDVIPSGSLAIDAALGVGGFPRGRVIEVYGPECLDEDTFIHYEVRHRDGVRANNKGGTIRRLYERFHKLPGDGDGRGAYQREVTENAEFYAPSINAEGRIIQNRIVNVLHAGRKNCFQVTTVDGQKIIASTDHRFWTGDKWTPLEKLIVGDILFVHNNTPYSVETPKDSNKNRVFLYVKQHPIAGVKTIVQGGKRYQYRRLRRARAVIEARMNGYSLAAWVDRLNSDQPLNDDFLRFLPRETQVHHRDENETNDDPENLEVLQADNHGRYHALKRHNNLRFTAVPTTIKTIKHIGLRETYDVQMENPFNNFVAEGFVVHNSGGKTTLTLHIIAQAQKLGGTCAFIDAEHALDPVYARKLGVDVDHLLVSQPDNGEQALEIAEALIRSRKVAVVVVDSVAALVPKAELEGDMGDPQMGLQARLMSQALRKLTGIVSNSQTCLIFINQIREKIGVMFGNPETTTGGRALKFYSSIRIDIRKVQTIKDGDRVIGVDTKAKIVKNKVAAPFREAEFRIYYGFGISHEWDLLIFGVSKGVLEKSGTWLSYKGERLGQGMENARIFLLEHATIANKIEVELRALLFPKGDKK